MSDQPLPPNDDSIQGQEAISRNGNPYRVDKQEPIDIEKEKDNPGVMEKHDFSIDVNWPPTKDWVDIPEEVKRIAAITRYKLLHAGPRCIQAVVNKHRTLRLLLYRQIQ